MAGDPFYARSSLGGDTAAQEAPPVVQDGAPAPEPEAGTPPAPELVPPVEGEPPAVPPPGEEAPPEGTQDAGGDPAKPAPAAAAPAAPVEPPAELTPEQKLERADELIKMAREEPAKFAVEHGIDMAPRFAKLGQMAQDIRKKEQQVKELEAGNAAKLKEAEEAIDLLGRDRVGFVEKYLGKDGMAKLNRAALAKDDPQYATLARLEDIIDAQNAKIEGLTAKLDGADKGDELSSDETTRAEAYFAQKGHEFATDYKQLAVHPENQKLIDFFGEDAVKEDALEIVGSMYRSTRRELTAEEVWSMLRTEFDERVQKIDGTAPPAKPPTQQPQPPGSENGPTDDNPPPGKFADTDFSPAAERARMRLIAARHSKA